MTAAGRLRIGTWMWAGFTLIGSLMYLGVELIRPWAFHIEAFVCASIGAFSFIVWFLLVDALYEAMPED